MGRNGVLVRRASALTTAAFFGLVLAAACGASRLAAQDGDDPAGQSACPSRGTLFQWSYGAGFSGGPRLDEPLVTDRPDFTEASITVGRGVTQVEMGYVYVNDREPDASFDGHSYPDLLIRQGMFADWFELRVGWTCLSERETAHGASTTSNQPDDLVLGVKLALTPQEAILPEMALVPQMRVTMSDDPVVGAGQVLPGVNWLYSWEINERISTGGSSQFVRALDEETGNPHGIFIQSWTIGCSIVDRVGAFTEWFALIPDGADTSHTTHYFDGGLTYLLNDNLQFDVRAGVGLNDAADDFFVGTGLSIRFP